MWRTFGILKADSLLLQWVKISSDCTNDVMKKIWCAKEKYCCFWSTFQDNNCLNFFSVFLIGGCKWYSFCHRWMWKEDCINFKRGNLLSWWFVLVKKIINSNSKRIFTSSVDQLFDSSCQCQVSVFIQESLISCVEPSSCKSFNVCFWSVTVSMVDKSEWKVLEIINTLEWHLFPWCTLLQLVQWVKHCIVNPKLLIEFQLAFRQFLVCEVQTRGVGWMSFDVLPLSLHMPQELVPNGFFLFICLGEKWSM